MEIPAECDPLMEIETSETTPKTVQQCQKKNRSASSALRRLRYRSIKVVTNLQKEIEKLKKEKYILRKRLNRDHLFQKEVKNIQDTIEKKVDQAIDDIKSDKIEEVKKKLLFNETLNRGVSEKYRELTKKEKRPFIQGLIDGSRLKKYGILSSVNFALKKKLTEKKLQEKKTAKIKGRVEFFLQEDLNSQVAPGKNEFIKRGGVRKQKRYLTDNMKNLHLKYCEKWDPISYSVFCKYRPFWVVSPSMKRDTCQCKLHSNMELLIKSLKKANIVAENSTSEVLKNMCCNVFERKCLERECQICKMKNINYKEFDNLNSIDYQEWIFDKQSYQGKDGQEKIKRVTLKKKKQDAPRNVIKKFEALLPAFFKHTLNITMQHSTIKDLKENLSPNEILCHIDFSENYLLKYNEEIQSFHFGGSREQISLHTGVLYYVDSVTTDKACKSFCTMSKNIKHDASAIWAHLEPVFKFAQELVPHLTKIHFLSDSPSSQYRNRFIFYMISKLKEQIPSLQIVSWNYQEAGHGKGAPDGIGAVVKRTADNHVRFGGDVATFQDFVEVVQKHIKNVELIVIAEEEISKKKFPKNIPTFKGTNKVHQALWCSSLPFDIVLRSLSCFACQDSYVPCMHSKHLGVLNVGLCQEDTLQSKASSNNEGSAVNVKIYQKASVQSTVSFRNHDNAKNVGLYQDTTGQSIETFQYDNIVENIGLCEEATVKPAYIPNGDDIVMKQVDSSVVAEIVCANIDTCIHIDSPTIFNNIGDLRQFDILETDVLDCDTPKNVKNSQKVKILSNIPVNYQRFDIPKSQGFSSIEQKEYEKFLQQRPVLPVFSDEEDIENIRFRYNTNDWVVVEYKIKKATHYFIGKIIEKTDNGAEYKIIFLRKGQGKSKKFGWPLISDEDVVSESRILQRLEEPEESRRGQFTFNNLPNLNFK